MVSKSEEIRQFLETDLFDDMLLKVGRDDIKSFKNNKDWVYEHPSEAIIFSETEKTWRNLSQEYNQRFKDLVTGDFPEDIFLIETLKTISDRLKRVEWNL